ncbi:hypothetical protein ABTE74_19715, partial [Acinetobacter baumannii]
LTDTKDIEYPFIRENSSSDTVNLYHYNEAIYKKLSTKGHQSLHSPFAKHWPQQFTGSFHDFINFSKPVDLSQALRSKGYMMVSCLNNAVINR